MPYIFVRNTMNTLPDVGNHFRIADKAFMNTITYIDYSHVYGLDSLATAIQTKLGLESPQRCGNASFMFSTGHHSPAQVLNLLEEIGYVVVAANTVGMSTVWTLRKSSR